MVPEARAKASPEAGSVAARAALAADALAHPSSNKAPTSNWDKEKAASWSAFKRSLGPAGTRSTRVSKIPNEYALKLKAAEGQDRARLMSHYFQAPRAQKQTLP